jgi:hypothetical protein
MERVQSLLLRGNRVEAVEEAIACRDFATALLVASMCDPETYKRTAKAYAENVFVGGSPMHTIGMLFSGSVQVASHAAPGNFWGIGAHELKTTWKMHLAAIISNRIVGWDLVALSLGDRLREIDDFQAAHFCYMVCGCPVTDPMREDTRMSLLGCDHRVESNVTLMATTAIEAYDRTEAYEWAKRRGNKNAAIKSLQPFKVIFATLLTDYGLEDQARLYALGIRDCSDIKPAAAKSLTGSSLLQIFEDRDALSGAFAELEKRLDLDDPQSEMEPVVAVREEVAMNNQSFVEEHRDVVNSTLNQTDNDATFVTAASNLMDNPGFSITPEKAELPATKPDFIPSKVEPAEDLSRKPLSQFAPRNDTVQVNKAPEPMPSKPIPAESDKQLSQVAPAMFMPPRTQETPNMSNGLPPMQTPTPLAAVTPKETKRPIERAPNTAPSMLMGVKKDLLSGKKKAPSSAERTRSGGLMSRLRTGLIKRFNPDATECTLPDNEEKPYYNNELKVWVFPGEDPHEVAKPIAPPPMIPKAGDSAPAPEPSRPAAVNDPLAAMMAPPTRKPAALRRLGAPSGIQTGAYTYPGMMPPMPGMASPAAAGGAPPQFAIFTPAKKEDETADE